MQLTQVSVHYFKSFIPLQLPHINSLFCFFWNTRGNRISASVVWNFKSIEMKINLINIVDLYRRKFCDGHNI